MMQIWIENLIFEAIIGILEKEKKNPQKVIVNCNIKYNYQKNDFLNYALICETIKNHITTNKYELLEDALLHVIKILKSEFPSISYINIKISKPEILANCDVSVSLEKKY